MREAVAFAHKRGVRVHVTLNILLKEEGEITAIEVKSSMTYHSSFADSITKLSDWIKTPVVKKIIVYIGDFENTASDVKLINYKNLLL